MPRSPLSCGRSRRRQRPAPELDDERRRYYRATGFGVKVLTAEMERLDQLVRTAQAKQVAFRLQPGWEGS